MVNAANSGTQMPITTGQICAFGKFMFAWVWLAFIYHLHVLKFRTQSGVTGFAYHAEKSKCLFSIKAAPNYITVKNKKKHQRLKKKSMCAFACVCGGVPWHQQDPAAHTGNRNTSVNLRFLGRVRSKRHQALMAVPGAGRRIKMRLLWATCPGQGCPKFHSKILPQNK